MKSLPSSQVAGVYHRKLGDVLVTGLSDGYVDMGYTIFRNIPEEEIKDILARDHRTSPPRISVNAFALRFGGRAGYYSEDRYHGEGREGGIPGGMQE